MMSPRIQLRESVIIANKKHIILKTAHKIVKSCAMELTRVKSPQDYHLEVLVAYYTREALD